MKLTEAAKVITAACRKIGGEISFDEEGPDIYWNNVRIRPDPKDVPACIDAITTLAELGANDQG